MFFIIGISPKSKLIGSCGCACPACGRAVNLDLSKKYSTFTFFFIPIIPFGASYLGSCPSCDSIMGLSKERGKAFERDSGTVIYTSDLQILQNNAGAACPVCGAKIIASQNFCYNCGSKL